MRVRRRQPPVPQVASAQHEGTLTLAEVCRLCAIPADQLIDLVNEGLVTPVGQTPPEWHFPIQSVRSIQMACRLQQDLEVNLRGAALAVELIEEIRTLRTRVSVLEQRLDEDP